MSIEKQIAEQVRVIESWAQGAGISPPCEIPCGVLADDVRAGVVAYYQEHGAAATWDERDGPNGTKAHLLRLAPREVRAEEIHGSSGKVIGVIVSPHEG